MTDNHEALSGLAEAYVLGTLDEHDARAFAAHLAGCDRCQRDTRELALVTEGLARALPPTRLPAGLRDRVLAHATGAAPAPPAVDAPPRHRNTRATWLALAASVIAVIMAGLAWQYRGDAERARSEQQAAAQHVKALEEQVAALQAEAATSARTRAVLSASDLARIELAGQPAAPGASGRVFWSPTHGLVFAATNLPPLPPGRVYQLWVVAETPISAGLAQPGTAGDVGVISRPAASSAPKAFALTIEPEGGRPAPTGPMFLLGEM
jgi:anti-sigma-K factor RskA